MNPIIYARRNIFFNSSSPITGKFDESRYPFVTKPLLSLDDVRIKSTVLYKPTQSVGTVVLQIATAYRLDIKRKTVLAVAQTDIDAKTFATVKLHPFLSRIPTLTSTVRDGRYSMTLSHWLWANHELIITGPGENAQNSTSCCYLHADEDHLWCVFYPGAFKAMEDRMGARYDRHAFHVTTAADIGTEIDIRVQESSQETWHIRCLHCNELFIPLWVEASRDAYNGHQVFKWDDSQSESETLDSLAMHCPHCDKQTLDTPRNRADMDEGADYVKMNLEHDAQLVSYHYNAFAPRWRPWRDLLAIYLSALKSVKLGELKPYENWVKKQEARSWTGEYPLLGDSTTGRDYNKSEITVDENKLRTMSVDRQEGKDGKGFHLWALVEEWERGGSSKRIEYRELSTWSDALEMQSHFGVKSTNCGVDFGNQVGRDVFGFCAQNRWFAMKSGDEEGFAHRMVDKKTKAISMIYLPFSEPRLEDPMSGKAIPRVGRFRSGSCPSGLCLSILWSKPVIYPILYALKNGTSGRYYGIARDFSPDYVEQLHSYVPATDLDKKTSIIRKVIWKKIKRDDHGFVMSAQSLCLAIAAGFFPLSEDLNKKDLQSDSA